MADLIIVPAPSRPSCRDVGARQHVSDEIGMVSIHPRINHRDNDTHSGAKPMHLVEMEGLNYPLSISNRVSRCGPYGGEHRDNRET